MYYLAHLHPQSAASQALPLVGFAPHASQQPTLAVVKHTRVEILSLVPHPTRPASHSPPWQLLHSLGFNARVSAIAHPAPAHLAVLTDHHAPRLILLRYDAASNHVVTVSSLPLDEPARQPAELGIALEIDLPPCPSSPPPASPSSSSSRLLVTHTHAGILKIAPVSLEQRNNDERMSDVEGGAETDAPVGVQLDSSRSFVARLPHPHLIHQAVLNSVSDELSGSATTNPALALLSVSSTPTKIPGLGPQCLPVLSFHSINVARQELTPLPWGPPRQVPPLSALKSPTTERSRASASQPSDMPGTYHHDDADDGARTSSSRGGQRQTRRRSGQANDAGAAGASSSSSSSRHGPGAFGATRTPEQERQNEADLARHAGTRAHVPLPYSDALGAHLLLPVHARAGGGVVVFSETSVLYVPPPSSRANASSDSLLETPGKRRKSSAGAGAAGAAAAAASATLPPTSRSSTLSVSPTKQSNENGKRRRSSAASSSNNPAATAASGGGGADGASPTSPTSSRKMSLAQYSAGRILRVDCERPMMVVSATAMEAPPVPDGGQDAAVHRILFATHAGRLHLLTLKLVPSLDTGLAIPSSLHLQTLGRVSVPGGAKGLTYLGEGFAFVASATGDSQLLRIEVDDGNVVDVKMSAPVSRPAPTPPSAASVSAPRLSHVRSWPNLAPILDFVVDDGAGGDASLPSSAQARVITASGAGPTGSLRVVRNGVVVEELGEIGGVEGAKRSWCVGAGQMICLGYASGTRLLAVDAQTAGVVELSADEVAALGVDATLPTLDVVQMGGGGDGGRAEADVAVHASTAGVCAFSTSQRRRLATWAPPRGSEIATASMDAAGQVLVGLSGGRLELLQFDVGAAAFQSVAHVELDAEACALDMTPVVVDAQAPAAAALPTRANLAAVALWGARRSVRLLRLPTLEDATPSALRDEVQPALPRSLKLHVFGHAVGQGQLGGGQAAAAASKSATTATSSSSSSSPSPPPHLLVALGDGSVNSYALDLPAPGSWSSAIGVVERRSAQLGSEPAVLRAVVNTAGERLLVACCSDRPTVISAKGGAGTRLTYSSMRYRDVADVAPLGGEGGGGGGGGGGGTVLLARSGALTLARVGEAQHLEVRTAVELGDDGPLALAQDGVTRSLGVVTSRFRAEGTATRRAPGEAEGKVLVYDDASFEELARFDLLPDERPNCIERIVLPDGSPCFLVGTGFFERTTSRNEAVRGRLLGFRPVSTGAAPGRGTRAPASRLRLERAFEAQVHGNVFGVAQVDGKYIAAAVNSSVLTFVAEERDEEDLMLGEGSGGAPSLSLRQAGKWACAFTACSLSAPTPGRLVVGDALRSMALLRVEDAPGRRGHLTELARDCDPYWTVSAAQIDDGESQTFVGSDIAFNLYTTQRLRLTDEAKRRTREAMQRELETGQRRAGGGGSEAVGSSGVTMGESGEVEWSHIMERRAAWHYGDMINRIKRGSLTARPAQSASGAAATADASVGAATTMGAPAADIDPRLVFCTSGGAVGVIAQLSDEAASILSAVERNANVVLPAPLGGIDVESWRTLRTDHRVSPPAGFVDGETLAAYAAMGAAERRRVLEGPRGAATGRKGIFGGGMEEEQEGAEESTTEPHHDRVHADPWKVGALVEALARLTG